MQQAVERSVTVAAVLRALKLRPTGSNYKTVYQLVRTNRWSTTHWLGQRHGLNKAGPTGRPLSLVLQNSGKLECGTRLKVRMLRAGLLKSECSLCGQKPIWRGKPLVLVLDHINGVNTDHRLQNLRLVCPNCNSQLSTFCSKNRAPMAERLKQASLKGRQVGSTPTRSAMF